MALRAKVLQKKAEKFELKKLEAHKVVKEQMYALEPLFQDVYANRRPKPADYVARKDLIRVFNEIAKELYGSKNTPVVVEFGSFVMDLFSKKSDLDLSVNFSSGGVEFPREKKIQTLRKFANKLYSLQSKGHVYGVLPITTAKVPILKCIDRGTGVECDISVENRDGISKSQIIHSISSIDQRFHKLSFLMKTWAKANNINSSKDKTLNSLSIILLVAFHLQTRSPPILPPFSALLINGTDPASVEKLLPKFANYGSGNKERVADLFVSLLIKLSSIEKLWAKGLCASTCSATWISRTWGSKVARISVEDFTDQSQNVARAVGKAEVQQIYICINASIYYIFAFMGGQITGDKLRDLLFGQDDGITTQIPPILHAVPSLHQANQSKKGKRKNQAMAFDPILLNKIIPMQACTTQSTSAKKMRGAGSWVPSLGWGANVQAATGTKPSSEGGGTQLPSGAGWGVSQQQSGDTWGRAQAPSLGGWGGTQAPSLGGWGVSQQPSGSSWGGTQLSLLGGWGGTQVPTGGGWGETQQTSQQPIGGSWGETRLPSGGGWGGASW